jgi:GTP cyclohydrolase I
MSDDRRLEDGAAVLSPQIVADELPDVHLEAPGIALALQDAGISDIRYPIVVRLREAKPQQTVATASLGVEVPADVRAVHMSRFVEILNDWQSRIGVDTLPELLADVARRLASNRASARFDFPLFLERRSPASGGRSLLEYRCSLEGELHPEGVRCTTITRVPTTSLCPCSREISDYGAHNQRSSIEVCATAAVDAAHALDFPDLIGIAEAAASAPVYPLLKRMDELHVTMQAYENAAFVEDVARLVAATLQRDARVSAGRVRVVNEESVHAHNAYATISWPV